MKHFFDKIKSYSFWVSFSAALIILLNAFGNIFGFKIENKIVEDCVMSIAGILVVFGIVTMNEKSDGQAGDDKTEDEENKEEQLAESQEENKEDEPTENEKLEEKKLKDDEKKTNK